MPRKCFFSSRKKNEMLPCDGVPRDSITFIEQDAGDGKLRGVGAGDSFLGDIDAEVKRGSRGSGLGRKQVNEPFHGHKNRAPKGQSPFTYRHEMKVPHPEFEPEVNTPVHGGPQDIEGALLPADRLKMSLLKKLGKKEKKLMLGKQVGSGIKSAKVFIKLMKILDPKKKIPAGLESKLDTLLSKSKSLKDKAQTMHKIFKHIGFEGDKKQSEAMILQALKMSTKRGTQGSGMCGEGKNKAFWRDFGRGFKSVMKPGLKILGAVAMATGQPEIGVPLEIASGLL